MSGRLAVRVAVLAAFLAVLAACMAITGYGRLPAELEDLMQDNAALVATAGSYAANPDAARNAVAHLRDNSADIVHAAMEVPAIAGGDWPKLLARTDDYRAALDRLAAAMDRGRPADTGAEYTGVKEQCTACHKVFGGG